MSYRDDLQAAIAAKNAVERRLRVIQGGMAEASAPLAKLDVLKEWRGNARASTVAHRLEARRRHDHHLRIGVALIALTVASAVLSALTARGSVTSAISAAISGVAALLAGLQTFLRSDVNRDAFNRTAAQYANLVRRMDVVMTQADPGDAEIDAIRQEMDNLAYSSPVVSNRINKAAREKFGLTV